MGICEESTGCHPSSRRADHLFPVSSLGYNDVRDDGRTYVFHLVQGVTLHDGTAFDAQAAKWNFDRILDPETRSWVKPYYTDIDQVDVVDTSTLRVRLKHPGGGLPATLAGYFQGIPMASPTSYATHGKDWVRHPNGAGPYMLKELVPGDHVTLVKNPAYHKPGLPYLDSLEFRIMKDPLTRADAMIRRTSRWRGSQA